MAKLPIVAIVGRPNVGKSTLFNRLVGKKLALVDDRPGVTRDRREGDAHLLGLDFRVIDTAGYEDEDPDTLPGRMRRQTEAAVGEADVALFLVDARAGIMPLDEEIARWLRSSDTPIVLAANKAEGRAAEQGILEALAVDQFEMVGTLSRGTQVFALLRAASTVHRVAVGDYLGLDHGRVSVIHDGYIELVEHVPDKQGVWLERRRTLMLNVNS